MSYDKKLRDPRWQRKRLEILKRDSFCCVHCYDSKSELHVHHRIYESGREPWEYPDENFVTLCKTCHECLTKFITDIRFNCGCPIYLGGLTYCHDLLTGLDWSRALVVLSAISHRPEMLDAAYELISSKLAVTRK